MSGYKSIPSFASEVSFIRPSVFRQISDFANVFKAFIGTNWIGLPFAFQQSGIVLGSVGLAIIAFLTDHCCQIIIKCKKAAVRKMLKTMPRYNDPETTAREKKNMEDLIEKKIMYSDIGRIAMGRTGVVLVEISLLITQLMFCVGYFIFIGKTIQSLFPVISQPVPNSTAGNNSSTSLRNSTINTIRPLPVSTAPIFPILVLIPVIPLILMAFIRRVRKLGPVSFISNISLLFAFISVLGYMFSGLHFRIKDMKLANWATFPVFFGQVTSAYEGIGTLIPIESSMAENRHRYPFYLHLALGVLSLILGCFGITGYLVYGNGVNQIVTQMLPKGPLVTVVQLLLCLAVLFTYPLQLFPVTEIIESYIFENSKEKKSSDVEAVDGTSQGRFTERGPDNKSLNGSVSNSVQESGATLVGCTNDVDETTELMSTPGNNAMKPIKKKPSWRKNFIRTVLVLITAGVAIGLKNDFAYVSALCGSVGSSMLAFILPCIFHIKLLKQTNSRFTIAKDIFLVMFGIIGGGVGLTVTIMQIVQQ